MELEKSYNSKDTEPDIYTLWEQTGFFNPDRLPAKKDAETFVVPIAPPNVTGSLHMGHALENTLVDILCRHKRMQGHRVLWIPGTDHAGIATQNVVEKKLKKEGKTRFDLGKEKFVEKVWEWREEYGDIILGQLKKLGCSFDWSRTNFTMEPEYAKAVEAAFNHYLKKRWIYQADRTVNWCTRCKTSLSDLEVEHTEERTRFHYITYGPMTVGTVRPETKLGDTALAVNPGDDRYKEFIGTKVTIESVDPSISREKPAQKKAIQIQVIADEAADPEFGTGVIKVTPAHDPTDFEIYQRHPEIPVLQVIDEDGRMTKEAGIRYEGMKVAAAREQMIQDLTDLGLIEKVEDYTHNVATCYRCHRPLEPIPSKQWYLKMQDLAQHAIQAVKSGKVEIYPKNFEKIYFGRLEQERDWCISRQLWWGHTVPVEGEEDVLDTWFSSALWPLATLGWPNKTPDFKAFYPGSFVSSARDIISLWIARMIFSGIEFTGKVPFQKVYIHPTVLTKSGQRMSKSLGTGIDPLGLIEQYGADATRFGLAWQTTGVQDIRFDEGAIVMGKKFANKIWNATRFVIGRLPGDSLNTKRPNIKGLAEENKLILEQLDHTIQKMDEDLVQLRFGQAAETIYHFFWNNFCDQCLEAAKKHLENDDTKAQTEEVLGYVLTTSLKLLHPFIPFITEKLWQQLPIEHKEASLMIEAWPTTK